MDSRRRFLARGVAVLAMALAWATGARAAEPVQVMVLGTYHFGNPGLDLQNLRADDVLQPRRQAEVAAAVDGLARFRPTRVAVEVVADSQPAAALPKYRRYRAGEGRDDRNEITQIGYRLADRAGLADVQGIDVDGDFPFEALQAWAESHGQAAALKQDFDDIGVKLKAFEASQATSTIGQLLRVMNEPAAIADDHGWYTRALRFGQGAEQPGAALLAAWTARNLGICARLVQLARPGDRVVVVYGAGHSHLLRDCVKTQPGWQLVEPNDYLPR